MSIHTVPTAKNIYICVIHSQKKDLIDCVGIVTSRGTQEHDNLMFVEINNESYVFKTQNIKYITKKEYFKGCLRG